MSSSKISFMQVVLELLDWYTIQKSHTRQHHDIVTQGNELLKRVRSGEQVPPEDFDKFFEAVDENMR